MGCTPIIIASYLLWIVSVSVRACMHIARFKVEIMSQTETRTTRPDPGWTAPVRQGACAAFASMFLVIAAVAPREAAGDELVATFEAPDTGAVRPSDTVCSGPPLPVVDLVGPDDSLAAETKTQLYRYQRKLNDISDAYLLSASDPGLANCVLNWLYLWARDGAMLGEMSAEGEFIRKSALAPSAVAFLKIQDNPHLDGTQVSVVVAWLNAWADVIRQDYSTRLDSTSRHNHNAYWAAWSVMAGAIATQDRSLFEWSIDRTMSGLDQVRDDGLLPLELDRGAQALKFHLLAVAPLVMTAELAAANGIDLYAEKDGALHRLVQRTLAALDDPIEFGRVAGAPQTLEPRLLDEMLAWVAIYGARFPDGVDPRWWNASRSASHRLFGGDVELFNADLSSN